MLPELVFIHGWGFDASFWDALAPQLAQFPQRRVDLGFFGKPQQLEYSPHPHILVGHSLGFVHGIAAKEDWRGWVAINGFVRFVHQPASSACMPPATLRAMRAGLKSDGAKTLREFHRLAAANSPPDALPDFFALQNGLDELQIADVNDKIEKKEDIPGLVLAGSNDPLVPQAASIHLGRLARNGGLMMRDRAGHLLPQTDPAWCAGAIADFVTAYCG